MLLCNFFCCESGAGRVSRTLYSLSGGSSNGSVGFAVNYPCYGCPRGGMCTGGAVVATPQHWGAADDTGVVSFSACPTGYAQDLLNRVDVGGNLVHPLVGPLSAALT